MKNQNTLNNPLGSKIYKWTSYAFVFVMAFLFTFPLYWIITGAFKTGAEINARNPVWFPTEWVTVNFEKLFARRQAPLFDLTVGGWELKMFGYVIKFAEYTITGPADATEEESAKVTALLTARFEARKAKNWAESDRIRDELAAMGVVVKDSKDGAVWSRA